MSLEIQEGIWIPLVTLPMGISISATWGHNRLHIRRETLWWRRLTPLDRAACFKAKTAILKSPSPGGEVETPRGKKVSIEAPMEQR
jgi:hypothetical protein